jgi:hypothetical protein
MGQVLGLARQDFLRHLKDGLISLQRPLLSKVVFTLGPGRAPPSGNLRALAALRYRSFGLTKYRTTKGWSPEVLDAKKA